MFRSACVKHCQETGTRPELVHEMFRSPNVENMTTTETRILNSMFFYSMHALRVSWKCRIPPTTRFTIFHKSDFLLSLQKPSASHANGKRHLSASKELDDPIRMRSGFYLVFISVCDAYILSFDFLATILARCSWKMQTSEHRAGLLPPTICIWKCGSGWWGLWVFVHV